MLEKLTNLFSEAPVAGAAKKKKSIDTVAREVIKGKWGSGKTRKKKLKKAGYDYNAVQKRVNQILKEKGKPILSACETQAKWMKNYQYKWQANPTIEKSKKYGTCVTYVACVLQRLKILKSGQYIWIDEKGKVIGANSKMTVTYPGGTLKSNKSKLHAGDIVIGGNGNIHAASGSHIFVMTGKWDGDNPYIYDQESADRVRQGKSAKHTWKGSFKVIAIIH